MLKMVLLQTGKIEHSNRKEIFMKNNFICLVLVAFFTTSVSAQLAPADVEQKLRQIYADKYPDNFSMQKTLIVDQLESYSFMQQWTSEFGVPETVFNQLKTIYSQKYPDNYSIQKTLIKDQCESYLFLQSYTSEPGVPNAIIATQKQKYAQKYPYNFSIQKTLVLDQVNAYLELQR